MNQQAKGTALFDPEIAADVLGSSYKSPLIISPSVHTFEFTVTNGYCTGNHAIIQVEDCFGSAKEVFRDQLEIVFLFDHSSGHAKKRSNGLDIKGMNKC